MNIYFESYGCTLNSGEARQMEEIALGLDHHVTSDLEDSDLIVFLTCTVIEPTEQKMLRRLKVLNSTGKHLVVSGCMAAVQPDRLTALAPSAVLIPTPRQVEGFQRYIHSIDTGDLPGGFDDQKSVPSNLDLSRDSTDISAGVPIAEGCLGECAYCITRHARGSLRSIPHDEILTDIQNELTKGAREIRLTAQDTGAYGLDTPEGVRLPELLRKICELSPETKDAEGFKVRVGMMNPNFVMPVLDELINAFSNPRIFSFLHLPVQSGSDDILKVMGRKYDINDFKKIVTSFREAVPGLTLSTDIIIGFPGESELDFEKTRKVLEDLRPNIVNLTRFSERPGTAASNMPGKLHGRTIKARSRELTELCRAISTKANKEYENQELTVLATECDIGRYKETSLARTDAYKPVVIDQKLELGNTYRVKITSVTEAYLMGELL